MSVFGWELAVRFNRIPWPDRWSVKIRVNDRTEAEEDCNDEATARQAKADWEEKGLQAMVLRNGRPLPEPRPDLAGTTAEPQVAS